MLQLGLGLGLGTGNGNPNWYGACTTFKHSKGNSNHSNEYRIWLILADIGFHTKRYLRTVLPVFTLATIIGLPITCVALSPTDGCCYGYFISAWVKFIVCRLLKKCILQNSLSKQEETRCGFDHKYYALDRKHLKWAIRPVKTYRHKQCYHNLQDY